MRPRFPYEVYQLRASCVCLRAPQGIPKTKLESLLWGQDWNGEPVGERTLFRRSAALRPALRRSPDALTSYEAWCDCRELQDAVVVGARELFLVNFASNHQRCAPVVPLLRELLRTTACSLRLSFMQETEADLDRIVATRVVSDTPEPPKSAVGEEIVLRPLESQFDIAAIRSYLLDFAHAFENGRHSIVLGSQASGEFAARHGLPYEPIIDLSPDCIRLTLVCGEDGWGRARMFLDWLLARWPCSAMCDYGAQWPFGVVTDHLLPRGPVEPTWRRPRFESVADESDQRAFEWLGDDGLATVERGLDHFRQPHRRDAVAALCRDCMLGEELESGAMLEDLPLSPYVALALFTIAWPSVVAAAERLEIDCKCVVSELPPELAMWKNLRTLTLCDGEFETLPGAVMELRSLQALSLRGCYELKTLPLSVSCLIELERLDVATTGIDFDGLRALVPALKQLPRLRAVVTGWSLTGIQQRELSRALPSVAIGRSA